MDSRPSKTLANTYKYPFKIKKMEAEKKEKKRKILTCNISVEGLGA